MVQLDWRTCSMSSEKSIHRSQSTFDLSELGATQAVDEEVDAGIENHEIPHKHIHNPPSRRDVEPSRERARLDRD